MTRPMVHVPFVRYKQPPPLAALCGAAPHSVLLQGSTQHLNTTFLLSTHHAIKVSLIRYDNTVAVWGLCVCCRFCLTSSTPPCLTLA